MKEKGFFSTKKLVLSALFISIGLVLPFLTGQIQQFGNKLLPMHLPVLLCGLICGWQYGAVVGFVLPILRSFLFGMPVMFPNAVSMSFELLTYGLIAGIVYSAFKKQGIVAVYISLITSMISGRIVWGIVQIIVLGINDTPFTTEMFMAGAFINAVPGIIIQLILIPVIMATLDRVGLHKFSHIHTDD